MQVLHTCTVRLLQPTNLHKIMFFSVVTAMPDGVGLGMIGGYILPNENPRTTRRVDLLCHSQQAWDNRASPTLHKGSFGFVSFVSCAELTARTLVAFGTILGTDDLLCSIDRFAFMRPGEIFFYCLSALLLSTPTLQAITPHQLPSLSVFLLSLENKIAVKSKPKDLKENWSTKKKWLHWDQHPLNEPHFVRVQGVLALEDTR